MMTPFFILKHYKHYLTMNDKQHLQFYSLCHIIIAIIYAIALGMIITGFILPPPGAIDNSVLVAVGTLFGFSGLIVIMYAIRMHIHAKFSYKDASIEVNDDNKK